MMPMILMFFCDGDPSPQPRVSRKKGFHAQCLNPSCSIAERCLQLGIFPLWHNASVPEKPLTTSLLWLSDVAISSWGWCTRRIRCRCGSGSPSGVWPLSSCSPPPPAGCWHGAMRSPRPCPRTSRRRTCSRLLQPPRPPCATSSCCTTMGTSTCGTSTSGSSNCWRRPTRSGWKSSGR